MFNIFVTTMELHGTDTNLLCKALAKLCYETETVSVQCRQLNNEPKPTVALWKAKSRVVIFESCTSKCESRKKRNASDTSVADVSVILFEVKVSCLKRP